MPELTRFFDKKPTQSFTLGPAEKNVGQTGFNELWTAWYDQGTGITYVKDALYNSSYPTGFHASGSQDVLLASQVSTTFDSGAFLWAAVAYNSQISVLRFSGSSYTTPNSFVGDYPVMFYNVSHSLPFRKYVYCFYTKSGESKIYSRYNQDNFSGERLIHQSFHGSVKTLNCAFQHASHPNKFSLLGLYQNGDGFEIISDCFSEQTGVFINFSGLSGTITNLNEYLCGPAENFTPSLDLSHENFAAYPTGIINYVFDSGNNTSGGYIWVP